MIPAFRRHGAPALWRIGLLLAGLLPLPAVAADPLTQRMNDATVRVLCIAADGTAGTGSGLVIGDGYYVVSNWHVVECTANGGKAGVLRGADRVEAVAAEVKAHDDKKDLSILRVAHPFPQPYRSFATVATLEKLDPVVAVGFPGAADEMAGSAGLIEATFTEGVVSRVLPPLEERATARLVQTSAAINPGNSGGPLFDGYGRVIGINTAKALVAVPAVGGQGGGVTLERVPTGEGIGWAVVSDELIPFLDRLGIAYDLSATRPNALLRLWYREPFLAGMALLLSLATLTALGVAATPRGRALARHTFSRIQVPSPLPPAPRRPALRGVSGPYAGLSIPLSQGPVAIGRDPAMAQLVLPPKSPGVSRRHAVIAYDAQTGRFHLEDCWSSAGTFVLGQPGKPGGRLPPGKTCELLPGDGFYLGSAEVAFEVILEP